MEELLGTVSPLSEKEEEFESKSLLVFEVAS